MDFGIIIGLVIAAGAIIGGNVLEGGHLESLVGIPAFIIVIGGTIGAVIVQFPLKVVKDAVGTGFGLIKPRKLDPAKLVDEIVALAQSARTDGILGLEKSIEKASHPLLAKGLVMAVDGSDSGVIRDTLETVITQEEEHAENAAKVFEAAGGYSPTVGIIGAVLGLIHVMSNLSDIDKVGAGIAAAFVATIYGVAAANIAFLPLAGRIKVRAQQEARVAELIITGVLSIQQGLNPKLVRERLGGYLPAHGKKGKGKGGAVGSGALEAA